MSKPIISVSGLRGIVGESLDPILASRYALAFAESLDSDNRTGAVLIGRDGRETGPMFADAIAAALMSAGFNVLYADVCATPTVGVLVRELNCSVRNPNLRQPQSSRVQRNEVVWSRRASDLCQRRADGY